MIEFKHDPEEIVRLGTSDFTLRTAVRKAMSLLPRPALIDIFRDLGKSPAVLGWEEIEWLSGLPEYAKDSEAAISDERALPEIPAAAKKDYDGSAM